LRAIPIRLLGGAFRTGMYMVPAAQALLLLLACMALYRNVA